MLAAALVISFTLAAYGAARNAGSADSAIIAKTESGTGVVWVDSKVLDFKEEEKAGIKEFNEGLIAELRRTGYCPEMKADGELSDNIKIASVIGDYCSSHYDPASAAIYKEGLKHVIKKDLSIVIDQDSPEYTANIHKYEVNENVTVTITPDEIYLDEYAEKPAEENVHTVSSSGWKYKKVAARRTLFKKVTAYGTTRTLKIYSVHTGGKVKYNGIKAKHSSDFYAYSKLENNGSRLKFVQISKLSEQDEGTRWHYKYLGKVTGSISVTYPIKLKITLQESLLGCQVITDKNGKVKKNYWPAL